MSYKDLIVWKESYTLARAIYSLTDKFPAHEKHGIIPQMRRAAVSIPSNIAEGYRRRNAKEIIHFCKIAFGSASELEVQLMLSKDAKLSDESSFTEAEGALQSALRLLNLFIRSIK
jgi:four helix bundle protein